MSHVLDDFALTIAQSEFRARPDFVPFEGSPSAEDFCIAALAAALRAERRRVAELEPDAKLGRMVREMPVEQRLIHTVYGDWWYGRNVRGEFGATGASPEAVLEAARKEQP